MEGQHHQHEEGKDIADTPHELGAPQLLERAETQQGAHGALSGICDQGVVGGRVHDRWLLGSRHPASLARSFLTRSARPNIRPSGLAHIRSTPTIGTILVLLGTRAPPLPDGPSAHPRVRHLSVTDVGCVTATATGHLSGSARSGPAGRAPKGRTAPAPAGPTSRPLTLRHLLR
ncbi:hypothetical protein Sdia_12920 [Streptomyces diastaticus subsp. diastaticus]|uniref:Uncharacterized protein n=1 Tax=Streptomyces diastaticus subsp. diastaticus TaxID=68040 RepID=A0ABQ1CKD4_STRDI|nr:hypothetical protein Sdia_12920 [Streptomyces diastaticus subsp. diastaticus]GGU35112.1 hypothetical protein GCM10015534_42250 [Streptomyces diastaticus subsp. diastaticus]